MRHTFDGQSVKRIARAVRWVEDFQMDEGEHDPVFNQNPAFETPLGDPVDDPDADPDDPDYVPPQTTVTVITSVELNADGLVFKTKDISTPYLEWVDGTDATIQVTDCPDTTQG